MVKQFGLFDKQIQKELEEMTLAAGRANTASQKENATSPSVDTRPHCRRCGAVGSPSKRMPDCFWCTGGCRNEDGSDNLYWKVDGQ